MTYPILRLLYAPDAVAPAGGASPTGGPITIDVPEIAPATSSPTIEDVDLGSSPAAERAYGVLGPKEAGFDDGTEEMERMEAHMEGRAVRERDPATGKFLPKAKKPEEENLLPKKAEPKPAAAKVAKAAPKPVAKDPPHPSEPAKFKIGETEKTAEEWAAEFAALKSQAEAATKPAPVETPKKEEPPAPKPEEIAAKEAEKFEAFVKREAPSYAMDPKELDDILAGGEKAAQAFAVVRAKDAAKVRQWAAGEFNRIIKNLKSELDPIREHHQRVAEYTGDQRFLEANPDIKSHPKGYETYRAKKQEFEDGLKRIEKAISEGTADERDKAWALLRRDRTPEDFELDLAHHTKLELAKLPTEPAKPAPQVERKAEVSKAASKPFQQDRPGGGQSAPSTESSDARQLREMEAYGH